MSRALAITLCLLLWGCANLGGDSGDHETSLLPGPNHASDVIKKHCNNATIQDLNTGQRGGSTHFLEYDISDMSCKEIVEIYMSGAIHELGQRIGKECHLSIKSYTATGKVKAGISCK